MKKSDVIIKLQKAFPDIEGIKDAESWGGEQCEDAIHLGNAAEGGLIDGVPAAEYYSEDFKEVKYVIGVHRKLQRQLHELKYFPQWYDTGTLLAYPI